MHAVVFDCEFNVVEGAQRRFWCGPYDPDPVVVQIGAVALSLDDGFDIRDTLRLHVRAVDRRGAPIVVDPFLTKLTGVTRGDLDGDGVSLSEALAQLDRFSGSAPLWSWGKDELNLLAISCYIAGIAPPIPATRFGNACRLLLAAGMPYADIQRTRSNDLGAYFGLADTGRQAHDALNDALSVAEVLRHLLRTGKLTSRDFEREIGPFERAGA